MRSPQLVYMYVPPSYYVLEPYVLAPSPLPFDTYGNTHAYSYFVYLRYPLAWQTHSTF